LCLLRDPENAKIVEDALRHFDGERCELASFVVMPNHVHAIIVIERRATQRVAPTASFPFMHLFLALFATFA